MHVIFTDNVRILHLSYNVNISTTTVKLSERVALTDSEEKLKETSAIL